MPTSGFIDSWCFSNSPSSTRQRQSWGLRVLLLTDCNFDSKTEEGRRMYLLPFPSAPLLLFHLMAFVWFLPRTSVTLYCFCPHIRPCFQNCPTPPLGGPSRAPLALDSQGYASDLKRARVISEEWILTLLLLRESLTEDKYLKNQSQEMESPVWCCF